MNNKFMYIKDLRSGMKRLELVFIVLETGPPIPNQANLEIRELKVADTTACITATIWGEAGGLLKPGDIVRLTNAYVSIWHGCLRLCNYKTSILQKIDEFCMVFNEKLNMSDPRQFGELLAKAESSNSAANKASTSQNHPNN
ncbi:hypothetical protein ILUMI_27279 [Ignelater luminosus]|uniref:Single-stranded DNA binding protein Ssb-like OB fold domain-containing protein n=1 Tax=Ignelater luminosus TaxID=2038154 RepID=A0A8K0C3K9_IGNLU|nr:hypothetical protein ILUMI_27279 [Ignelater luminosus]